MGGINKRNHLIQVGQDVIWAKGYDLCSIKDITTAAGLPKGSFYHYFETKEKFALEAMNEYIVEFKENRPSKTSISSLEKMINSRIQSIIKIEFAKECYMSVMCHAYSNQDENFRLEVINAINSSNEAMLFLLKDLKKNNLIKSDLNVNELMEFIDFGWRGARLKSRLLKSDKPLKIFKKYLLKLVSLD